MTGAELKLPGWLSETGPLTLDEFVKFVDDNGGPSSPNFMKINEAFEYVPAVQVDQSLDPYSDAYFGQMIALYEELSNRSLDQEIGEHTPFEFDKHLNHANPLASDDPRYMSSHARAIITAIMVANLPDAPKVLDLGCGWGQTTELLSFTGADVTAVDINPDFVQLVQQRADRQGRKVDTICSNFDDFEAEDEFDMVLFYECMHHAVTPWKTLAKISDYVAPNGRIVFAGEPINDFWWATWGLRLDAISVYCIRKFGWFESGWSEPFLIKLFDDIGWELQIVQHVGLNNGPVGVAHRKADAQVPSLVLPVVAAAPAPVANPTSTALNDLELRIHQAQEQVQQLTAERDHARRFPWKYVRTALQYARNKRRRA